MTRTFTLDPARLQASGELFYKFLDDIDKFCEQLRADLLAPPVTRRFAHATSVQLTLLDITDNPDLAPELRQRAAALLARLEAHALRDGAQQH